MFEKKVLAKAVLAEYLTYKNEIDHLKNRILKGVITPIIKRYPDLKPVGHKRRLKER